MPFRRLSDRSVTVEVEFGTAQGTPRRAASKKKAASRPKKRRTVVAQKTTVTPPTKRKRRTRPAITKPTQASPKKTGKRVSAPPRRVRAVVPRQSITPPPTRVTSRWRIDHPQNRAAFVASVRASRPATASLSDAAPTQVPHDDVAIGLADATPEHIAFVNALNAKFSEHRWKLGWGSNQIRFEAYCGGKNGYVVRRYVEDCTGLEKPIGMGPKGLDNFFRRHHGIDWNTFLSTPSDELLMKATKMASKTATEASAKPQKPKATKPKKEKAEKPATTKRTKRGRVASSSSCPPLEADGSRCITPDCIAQLEQECGKGRQTLELHTQDGKLTAERKKLHDRIIADIRREQKCVADKDPKRRPVAILTGGAPGSGKSTYLKRQLGRLLQRESGTLHIDADDIRARLPEYQGWNAMLTHDETKIIVNRLIDEVGVPCAADIIYDGTMNSPKRYLPIIEKLKSLGYAVIGYWIDVDKGVSEQRVLARYKKSGRYVPTYVIDEFYRPGAEALRADVLEKLDAWRSVESPTWKTMQTKNEGYLLGIEKYFKGTGKLHEAKLLQPTSEAAQPGGAKGARSKPQAVAPRAKKAERRPKQASTEETAVQPLPTTSGPTDADLDRVEAMMAQLEATLRNIAA